MREGTIMETGEASEMENNSGGKTEFPRSVTKLPATVNYAEEVAKLSKSVDLRLSHPPRQGKNCLVLDVDQTLCEGVGDVLMERPFLHQFLKRAYKHYDIVIWSATSETRLRWKLNAMGMLRHRGYQITALLDRRAMGELHCKPLRILWDKCPQFYNPKNTVIVDDQVRNFKWNPQNGLAVKRFKPHEYDYELQELAVYLEKIAGEKDLRRHDHHRWKESGNANKF